MRWTSTKTQADVVALVVGHPLAARELTATWVRWEDERGRVRWTYRVEWPAKSDSPSAPRQET